LFKAEGNKYRELFLWIIIFIFLSALPIKLIFFQKSDFSAGKEFSSKASLRKSVLLAKRGEILDRNNLVLAEDIPSYEIGLSIKNFSFDPAHIKAISENLDLNLNRLNKRLSNKNRKYLVLSQNIRKQKKNYYNL
jgi:cell division protein FtsI/penicillin-binding protein 2